MNIEIIGYVAGALTIIALVPQAIKVFQTENTKALSLINYTLTFLGVFLWVVFGVITKNIPVLVSNALVLTLLAIILSKKICNLRKGID